MAEKKQHKIVSASTGKTVKAVSSPSTGGSTTGLRIGAVVLWIAAIVCEVVALGAIFETIRIPLLSARFEPLTVAIVFLILDLIFVIIGSQLWKKANHINPASKQNAVKFWLWNNMGVIVAAIAFIPFIIILLKSEDTDPKTKTVGSAVAAIALLIAGISSYDFNPVSAEDMIAQGFTSGVYWTKYGTVFHTHEDCSSLSRSDELTTGSIAEAQTAGRERLCKKCEQRDENAGTIKRLDAPKARDNKNDNKAVEKPAA